MIFLVGLPQDSPLRAVRKALHELGPPVVFFDPHTVLEAEVQLRVDAQVQGFWRMGPQMLDLQTVTAMYLRQVRFCRVPAVWQAGPGSHAWRHACNVEEVLLSWAELTSACVVNRPSAMASNHSKPYQASLIQSCGFTIPETLVTTDPEAVRSFWDQHGTVIYKSLSSVRSIVTRLALRASPPAARHYGMSNTVPAVYPWPQLPGACGGQRILRVQLSRRLMTIAMPTARTGG